MTLAIIGTDGRCQCCGERGAIRHVDPDLGFVCTECFCLLIFVETDCRQLAALHPPAVGHKPSTEAPEE